MINIELRFKLGFFTQKIKRQLPENWSEITAPQLVAIAHLIRGETSEELFLAKLCNVRTSVIKRMDAYQRYKITQYLQFTKGYEPWYKFIINIPGTRHPRPRLESMTFGQFMFVDSYYSDWCEDQQPQLLNKMVGSLYLPDGEKFDSELTALYQANAAKLPDVTKLAITLNYRLLKEWLTNLYPMIFVKPYDDGTEKAVVQDKKNTSGGWLPVFESIVGDDIIHQEQYFNLPVHNVFRFLNKKIKENAKR